MTTPPPSPSLETAQGQFLAAIRQPNTARTYRQAFKALSHYFKETRSEQPDAPPPLAGLSDDLLVSFYLWLDARYSPHTVGTYLAALQRLLVWLDANDLLPPGFQLGKAQNRLKVALGERGGLPYHHRRVDPELPRLITYYDDLPLPQGESWRERQKGLEIRRNRAIAHTLYASAGRVSEVAGLTRELVLDGRLDEIQLTGKGGKTRVILLTAEAKAAIRAYLAARADPYPGLFISHSKRNYGRPLGRNTLWRVVKEAAIALDLHHSTSPHAIRHYRATQLLNLGLPLELVQAYLGHANISTTRKVYAHTHTSILREKLAALDQSPREAVAQLEKAQKREG
jgi:site-specific recombinase XerD